MTDLESDGWIVKSTGYRSTCTDTRYGTRNRSNEELGWDWIQSTISMNYVESHEATESFNDTVHTASGPSKDEIGRTQISKEAKYGMESEKITYKYGIPEQLRIPEWVVTTYTTYKKFRPRNLK